MKETDSQNTNFPWGNNLIGQKKTGAKNSISESIVEKVWGVAV